MDKESKFTKDSDGYTAVRVVLGTESLPASDKDWMFARDENGNIAVRVVLGAGGGGITHNLGLYEDIDALEEAHPTGEPGDYALLASTDTFWVWDEDTSAWVDTDRKGQVSSVNGKTGDVVIPALVTSADTSITQELATETIYNYGELTALTITFPATPTASYISQVNFSSGTTATALTAPVDVVWSGDDIVSDVFVPDTSKRYSVLFFYDGASMCGIAKAN